MKVDSAAIVAAVGGRFPGHVDIMPYVSVGPENSVAAAYRAITGGNRRRWSV